MELKDLFGSEDSRPDSPPKESPLKSLEADLKFYNASLKEVSTEIMVEGISMYPIFIAHQHQVSIGEPILDKDELNTEWSIHASTLEEFVEKEIILPDKKAAFIKNFKSANDFMCLFVIVPEGANFVFYPFRK